MLFIEGRFFGFFLAVFAVHWALRGHRARKLWLLLASYVFYGAWDWRFLGLIWLSTAVDYTCGRAMEGHAERSSRRPWLLASLVTNLSILGFYKYFDFFVGSAAELAGTVGLEVSVPVLNLVLPVGISFYTFQTMSYAVDVYRGRLSPMRDAVDFALYVAFFPQLVAGPIVRAVHFRPQLEEPRRFSEHVAGRASLALFLVGFFKKACVADGIAGVVDPVFASPELYSRTAGWLAAGLYHVQIYCDFSGYSDMAIATAGLLGYRLPLNFAFPYLARSIGDFWRRWHISLATWMRDYVYLSVVGPRPTNRRRLFAVYVTLGLCGLWHGAAWGFVGFGLLHATYLTAEDVWRRSSLRDGPLGRVSAFLSAPLLTLCVLLTWPIFRIGDFGDTLSMFGILFGAAEGGELELPRAVLGFLLACAVVHGLFARFRLVDRFAQLPHPAFAALFGFLWAFVLPWVADDTVPFIYFQF